MFLLHYTELISSKRLRIVSLIDQWFFLAEWDGDQS